MDNTTRARVDALKQGIASLKSVSDTIAECGITIEDKPAEMPSRPGYKWVPHQAVAGGSIAWIEAESEDKSGTADQPITFVSGMSVHPNYFYTDGEKRYVCLMSGNPTEIVEGDYFTEF